MEHSFQNQYSYEMNCIKDSLRLDRNLKLIVSIVAIGVGVWSLWFTFNRFAWFFGALALTSLVVGVKLLFNVIQEWKVEQMPLMQLLSFKREKIVWVYSIVTEKLPFGVFVSKKGTMYFKLLDGDEITIRLTEKEIPLVAKSLNYILPHATFGYSKEYEQWYMANPAMLLK